MKLKSLVITMTIGSALVSGCTQQQSKPSASNSLKGSAFSPTVQASTAQGRYRKMFGKTGSSVFKKGKKSLDSLSARLKKRRKGKTQTIGTDLGGGYGGSSLGGGLGSSNYRGSSLGGSGTSRYKSSGKYGGGYGNALYKSSSSKYGTGSGKYGTGSGKYGSGTGSQYGSGSYGSSTGKYGVNSQYASNGRQGVGGKYGSGAYNGASATADSLYNSNKSGNYSRKDLTNPKSLLAKKIIYFEYDSAEIRFQDHAVLDAHADFLKNYPDIKVSLEGHADERGSREYNVALSERRAQTVMWYLKGKGVAAKQMDTVAYGEEKPAVEGSGQRSWAKNRRVELNYYK